MGTTTSISISVLLLMALYNLRGCCLAADTLLLLASSNNSANGHAVVASVFLLYMIFCMLYFFRVGSAPGVYLEV